MTNYITSLGLSILCLTLSACSGGSNEVRITEGRQNKDITVTAAPVSSQTPLIVHTDASSRIATIRNGRSLPEGFLIATNRSGKESSVLKALPALGNSTLRTADILEGKPNVNDTVSPANTTRSQELAKIYRDAEG